MYVSITALGTNKAGCMVNTYVISTETISSVISSGKDVLLLLQLILLDDAIDDKSLKSLH